MDFTTARRRINLIVELITLIDYMVSILLIRSHQIYLRNHSDCRQEFKGGRSSHGFRSLKKFQETYTNDVLFDEYIVADTEYLRIHFYDDENPKKYFYIGKLHLNFLLISRN